MSLISSKALAVAKDMQGKEPSPSLAPNEAPVSLSLPSSSLITAIIAIITDVMQAFSQCGQTPSQVTNTLNNPGPIAKISLRRSIRRNVPNSALHEPIMQSTFKIAAATTQSEVQTMLQELQYAY